MKKLSILIATIFLFSCSKNEELLQVETTESSEALITPAISAALSRLVTNISDHSRISNLIIEGTSRVVKNEPAFGLANNDYNRQGPYQVATINVDRGRCVGPIGTIQNFLSAIGVVDSGVQCTPSLPYGFQDRRITEIYYPANIASLGKVPVVNFVGGLTSNAGNYDALLNLWASYGFIVVNTNNFINFSPSLHFTGIQQLVTENNDPQSPLYNKADLSKIIVSGHSAGGGGAILISTGIGQNLLRAIDPNIRIAGSFPLQASFNATGLDVEAPTLILTGERDPVVNPHLQGIRTQYNLISKSRAWYMCTRNSNHSTPTLELARNDYAGITVAFIRYIGQNDAAASRYFVGSPFRALQDPGLVTAPPSLTAAQLLLLPPSQHVQRALHTDLQVRRNALAGGYTHIIPVTLPPVTGAVVDRLRRLIGR